MSQLKKGVKVNFSHKAKTVNGFNLSTKKGKIHSVKGHRVVIISNGIKYDVSKESVTLLGEKTALTKALSIK